MDARTCQLLAWEQKLLAPEEMSKEQEQCAAIREELAHQKDRLFDLREEFEDLQEELKPKRFLDCDIKGAALKQYEEKIKKAQEEIHDLEISLLSKEREAS